jgi:signal peptidase I
VKPADPLVRLMNMREKGRRTLLRFWYGWGRPLLTILLVVGAVRSAGADWNDVPSGSMEPTIEVGDRIFVNKLAYDLKVPFTTWRVSTWAHPERGDVVVLYSPLDGKRLVKRVVGLPGDRLEVRDHRLILNGRAVPYHAAAESLEETLGDRSHAVRADSRGGPAAFHGPLVVPEGQYFVMGDWRGNSLDSRFFGAVPRASILGRATMVVLSVDYDHALRPRWERFFTALR